MYWNSDSSDKELIERVRATPRNEVAGPDIDVLLRNSCTSPRELKFLLPRALELCTPHGTITAQQLGSLLEEHLFATWPAQEREAVHRFFLARWNVIHSESISLDVVMFLELLALLGLDSRPYLIAWEENQSPSSTFLLADFIVNHLADAPGLGVGGDQVRAWLLKPHLAERLEIAYFIYNKNPRARNLSDAELILRSWHGGALP